MNAVYVIDAIRTPIGRYGGALSSVRPDDLLALVIKEIVERNPSATPALIEEVIAGAANQSGEDNRNVARMAALLAGLPVTVAGVTVNRLCASGLQAVMDGARQIICGDAELLIAGGVESMTRAPYVMAKSAEPWARKPELLDTTMGWRFINKNLAGMYHPFAMGETAENVAKQWKISRKEQDEFAFSSQEKYFAAKAAGKWNDEICPVHVPGAKGEVTVFDTDEHPRQSTLEKLAQLLPAFIKEGTVTAGNSSGINDGGAALMLASEQTVKNCGLKPMAQVRGMAVAGVDPSIMGIGPVPAVQKAVKRSGLTINDIGLFELNEAFAAQSIACIRDLELDIQKVNVNGGAIALGHPLGCSGARISATLLYEMKRRKIKYGVATMCVGVGQGAAIVYENYDDG
jgi:3-oxoadipyl-CoA thiolase